MEKQLSQSRNAPIKLSEVKYDKNAPEMSGRKSILKKSGAKSKSVSFNP
jgi:hypothetical protein